MNSFCKLKFLLTIIFLTTSLYSSELKKVTLQLAWFDQFQYAGYYIAKEKGFYKELGLDVEIVPFSFDKNIIKDVNDGKIDFAVGRENLILEKQKYPNIVALAAIFQASPLILISKKDSKIEKIEDFANKRIMTTRDDAEEASLKAMLVSRKVDIKTLNFIPHSHNIKDLINSKTDLISAYTSKAPFFLNKYNIKYNTFSPKDYGFDMYSDFLYTNSQLIATDPNVAILFKNASMKGWEYAYSNISEATELILNKYNTQNLTKEELIFEANELKKLSYYETKKLGEISYEKLKRIYDLYNVLGLVEKPIDVSEFIFKPDNNLIISNIEKNFLNEKEILNLCIVPNYMPYSDVVDGKFIGFVADYMALVENSIKKPIKFVQTKSIAESFTFIKEKKCDILPMAIKTKERESYLSFTKSYLNLPLVLITKSGEIFTDDLRNLKNKKVSIVDNYAFFNTLKNKYKNIEFVKVKNLDEGFEKVLNDENFAHIDFMQSSWYKIQTDYMSKLQISAKLDESEDISIAVLKENTVLSNILDKAVLSIDKASSTEILNKWVIKDNKKEFNYNLLLQISFVVFIIFSLGVYRQILLNKANKRLKYLVDLKTKKLQNVNKRLSIRIKRILEKSQQKDRILAQQQKMVSMGQMIENIAHQWRQPLSVISTNASAIKLKKEMNLLKDDELIKTVEQIVNTSKYLSQTIDDFRYFFRPQKDKEIFSLASCIKKCLDLINENFVQNNIKIIYKLEDINVLGYETELIQVLINILNNSKDAFVQNNIDKKLIFITLKEINKKVHIEIYDNALGVSQIILDKVFEPYFTTKYKSSGTGIGLYMSKEIVTRHMDGDIFMDNYEFIYENEKYKGAKLSIVLNTIKKD
ncbi:ABC transporter substrate-binding protein [Aliarcobacter cibarius]|uniref:histidine kinase n=1 Tax=Aliarcobacter cibarius TaxID=255507 RepID=A0A5J6RJU4_9BACT|nr:ABC transporter substrate-binding protein [Aliarcobacter cibarius]MBP9491463.1 ABC transporter substrate-binding protein [Aliarcobacter sp.]QEZ89667.1 BvgS-like domain-containing signal transduction sensor histidine kinase (NMT1 domain) [Aliarcobacter cibarius]QKJ27674.1 BvgS-like domain-containing signal transduction sensor histidine kinase (NMT1 domain) [Aliarcobacter cibarius]TLT00711.1 transporter substrate-binding domain-containing protein [Aliarcobacter cibarius]TLT01005.1 transporter